MHSSCETRAEARNDPADQIGQMLDRFQQRLTVDNPRLAERYVKAEIHLLVHFSIRGVDEQLVAYLQRAEIIGGPNKKGWQAGMQATAHLPYRRADMGSQVQALKAGGNSDKQSMLVDVVKFVENPEIVSLPSFVWFDTVERVYGVLPQSLYFSLRTGFVMVGIGVPVDVERGVLALAGETAAGADRQEVLVQVIERGSEVVSYVSSDDGDAQGDGIGAVDIVDQLARLRIALGSDFIWLGVEEGAGCAIQVSDVFFGPFNFRPDEREPFICGRHNQSRHNQFVPR